MKRNLLLSLLLVILLMCSVSCALAFSPDFVYVKEGLTISDNDEFYLIVDDPSLKIDVLRKMMTKKISLGTGGQPLIPFEVCTSVYSGCYKQKIISKMDSEKLVQNINEIRPSGTGNCYYIKYYYGGSGILKDSSPIDMHRPFNLQSMTNRLNSNLTASDAVAFFRIEVYDFNTGENVAYSEKNGLIDILGGVPYITQQLFKEMKKGMEQTN